MGKKGALKTVKALLEAIGLTSTEKLDACDSLEKEWSVTKTFFRRKCLEVHPDKGGTEEAFRTVNSAFETLRSMYEKGKITSFTDAAKVDTGADYEANYKTYGGYTAPSYEWYEMQAEEDVPKYKVEIAKSGRSACCKFGTKRNEYKDKKCPIVPGVTQYKIKTMWRSSKSHEAGGYNDEIPYTLIEKGMVRIGMIDEMSGAYGRWCHRECWHVPKKVWFAMPQEGHPDESNPKVRPRPRRTLTPPFLRQTLTSLPSSLSLSLCSRTQVFETRLLHLNEVLFTGMQELSPEQTEALVRHVMDRGNWASYAGPKKLGPKTTSPSSTPSKPKKLTQPKPTSPVVDLTDDAPKKKEGDSGSFKAQLSQAYQKIKDKIATMPAKAKTKPGKQVEAAKKKFVMPRPGVGKARAGCLSGKTCVLTGLFPEVGGGSGLSLGKDKTKAMVESFGGRVTGSVSGKTDVLIVGKEPGMSKVSKGRQQERCTLMNLEDFVAAINEDKVSSAIEQATTETLMIDNFSTGYGGNGLAFRSSQAAIEFAEGKTSPLKKIEAKRPSEATKSKAKKKMKFDDEVSPPSLPLSPRCSSHTVSCLPLWLISLISLPIHLWKGCCGGDPSQQGFVRQIGEEQNFERAMAHRSPAQVRFLPHYHSRCIFLRSYHPTDRWACLGFVSLAGSLRRCAGARTSRPQGLRRFS